MTLGNIHFGPFCLDLDQEMLTKDGKRVPLRPQALSALIFLVKNRERVVSREELGNILWPDINVIEDQSLNVLMRGLREALGDRPRRSIYIETIPRRGYRFIGSLRAKKPWAVPGRQDFLAAGLFIFAVLAFGLSLSGINTNYLQKKDPVTVNDLSATAHVQFLQGINLFEERQFGQGRALFAKLVAAEPNFPEGYYWLGRAMFWETGFNLETANNVKPLFSKALELKPSFPDALVEMAYAVLIADLDAKKAIDFGQQALKIDPDHYKAQNLLGMVYLGLDDPETALNYFAQTNIDSASKTIAVATEGWAYYFAGELETAARICRILLRGDVQTPPARDCLFETYLAMGEEDLALAQARDIMEENGVNLEHYKPQDGAGSTLTLEDFYRWRRSYLEKLDFNTGYGQAVIDLRLGNQEEAFLKLQNIVRLRQYPYIVLIQSDPRLYPLRNYPDSAAVFDIFK